MKFTPLHKTGAALLLAVLGSGVMLSLHAADDGKGSAKAQKATLTVQTTRAQNSEWPRLLAANGSITAWQEAVIGAELGGQRLAELAVNVGDQVKKGQVLARFASEAVAADLAQAQAALAEAQAALEEARANASRAASLSSSGAISAQQIMQFQTAEKSAAARLQSAKARVQTEQIRNRQVQVLAPDDGVISARAATIGVVAQQGQELFKMVRNNRLEWRAEVNANELGQIKPGMKARLVLGDGSKLEGKVRVLAPTIDPQTRNALVYVDLPGGSAARAGMFASGQFELGQSGALTLPQSAVVVRDGFGYVFQVEKDGRVKQLKINLGRRLGERIEVSSGVTPEMNLVAQGAGFLADGDLVQVVAGAPVAAGVSATQPVAKK